MADLIAKTSKENDRREIFLHPPFLDRKQGGSKAAATTVVFGLSIGLDFLACMRISVLFFI
jgi:hypothetical protein